jgi:hypothetical protein
MRNRRVRLHTRDDLINYAGSAVFLRRHLVRAITEGTVEVLGGFTRVPPKGLPGWCLLAESPTTGYTYKLGVTVEPGGVYRVWNLDKFDIPWPSWIGDAPTHKGNTLMTGDQPHKYEEFKRATTTSEEEEGKETRELAEG